MFIVSEDRKDGFTLTEVIVVIVIIAALAIILIPNMLSLMPDDHNIKYKKAFYTIQEIVNDIAQECQGLKYVDGEWTDSGVNEEDVLSYCHDSNGNHKGLGLEICKRLSAVEDCSNYKASDCGDVNGDCNYINVLTTNGMKWYLPKRDIASYVSWGTGGTLSQVFVNVDGNEIKTGNPTGDLSKNPTGTYRISITSEGKVKPTDTKEKNLLLDNPTKD